MNRVWLGFYEGDEMENAVYARLYPSGSWNSELVQMDECPAMSGTQMGMHVNSLGYGSLEVIGFPSYIDSYLRDLNRVELETFRKNLQAQGVQIR